RRLAQPSWNGRLGPNHRLGAPSPPRPPRAHAHGHQPRRAHRARLIALPVRPGERAARVRPRPGARVSPGPAGRIDTPLGAGRDARSDARRLRRGGSQVMRELLVAFGLTVALVVGCSSEPTIPASPTPTPLPT